MHLPFWPTSTKTSPAIQMITAARAEECLLVVGGHLLTAGLADVDALHLLLDGRHGEAGLGQVGGLELEAQGLVLFAGAPALEPWVGLGGQVVGQVLGHRHAGHALFKQTIRGSSIVLKYCRDLQ